MGTLLRFAPPATVFLGALLLFWIQPLAAKALLPAFGGSAAVWTAALAFFQLALVGGYALAHVAPGFVPGFRLLHAVLLGIAWILLPDRVAVPRFAAALDPSLAIVAALAATVGGPFLLLSATTPLVQRSLVGRWPEARIYGLYAVSNAGSLLGLWMFPLALEPLLGLRAQLGVWASAFAVYALLAILSLRGLRASAEPAAAARPAIDPLWVGLPAVGTVLLLGVTNQLCLELVPLPLLWVLPLSIYLVSWIVAFVRPDRFPRLVLWRVGAAVAAATILFSSVRPMADARISVASFSAMLFLLCWLAHGELAKLRPPEGALTRYFLASSAGGALGGLFVAVVAPRIFSDYRELGLAVAATFILSLAASMRERRRAAGGHGERGIVAVAVAACGLVAALLVLPHHDLRTSTRRGFYGVLRIVDAGKGETARRRLDHGGVKHGEQFLAPAARARPLSYYDPDSGAGLLLDAPTDARRVGLVGLGAGTLAAYARPGDRFRFFEIDPLVVEIARERFFYLADARGEVDVVLGDGRLALAAEPARAFDAFVVDAFSGDAIPAHLLTLEAVREYRRVLEPGGVLALHVSNRALDLCPAVRAVADALGLSALVVDRRAARKERISTSRWILLGPPDSIAPLRDRLRPPARLGTCEPLARPWTDDYSNLIAVFKRRGSSPPARR